MRALRLGPLHVAAIVVAAACGLVLIDYARDLSHAQERVASGSTLVQTPCGPIEYAAAGEGPAVLMVHGAGGGFDQASGFVEEFSRAGFRAVAMSRFGYLRTPLPRDASPAAQADTHACLLDALGIERAAIVGVSAGAPSTMLFALRHPQRASAMVLIVPLAYAPREPGAAAAEPSPAARFMFERALRSDFLYWAAAHSVRWLVLKTILATPPEVLASASVAEKTRVRELMINILPLTQRQAGIMNDSAIGASIERYELERIAAPTLVVSVVDDLYGTFHSARYTAAHIPGARLVAYSSGGHVWVGHHGELMREVVGFLEPPKAPLAWRR